MWTDGVQYIMDPDFGFDWYVRIMHVHMYAHTCEHQRCLHMCVYMSMCICAHGFAHPHESMPMDMWIWIISYCFAEVIMMCTSMIHMSDPNLNQRFKLGLDMWIIDAHIIFDLNMSVVQIGDRKVGVDID